MVNPPVFHPHDIKARFPCLWNVLRLWVPTSPNKGLCFHRAVALALDMPASKLVVGIVRAATDEERAVIPNASEVPFLHCWLEVGNSLLYAPTTYEQCGALVGFNKQAYYDRNGVTTTTTLSRRDLMELAKAHKWRSHFRYAKPQRLDAPLTQVLLMAMGVIIKESSEGTALPVDNADPTV